MSKYANLALLRIPYVLNVWYLQVQGESIPVESFLSEGIKSDNWNTKGGPTSQPRPRNDGYNDPYGKPGPPRNLAPYGQGMPRSRPY